MNSGTINDDLIGGIEIGRRSELYRVLYKGLPEFRSERDPHRLSGIKLADALGLRYQSVYNWFSKDRLPVKWIDPLIELEGSTLDKDVLYKFAV